MWLLALSYLYLEITTDERAMGVFILPIVVGLQTIPALYPGVENADPVLDSPWFWVHVASLLFAYASFALAGVLGLTYMLQFKEIKKKHLGYFYTRLPSLQMLDAMNSRAVAIGWLFLTIGVVVGVIWTAQARAIAPDEPEPAGDVAERSEDLHGAADVGGVFVRDVRAARRWAGPAGGRLAVGGRVRDRAAELPADQLFRHDQPHVPVTRVHAASCSASVTGPRPSNCVSGSTSRAAIVGAAVEALAARPSAARVGRPLDVQPIRDLRRQR